MDALMVSSLTPTISESDDSTLEFTDIEEYIHKVWSCIEARTVDKNLGATAIWNFAQKYNIPPISMGLIGQVYTGAELIDNKLGLEWAANIGLIVGNKLYEYYEYRPTTSTEPFESCRSITRPAPQQRTMEIVQLAGEILEPLDKPNQSPENTRNT